MNPKHLWQTITWDGLIPLTAACIPAALAWAFPGDPFLVGLISEFVPIVVAVVRAHVGYRQLAVAANSKPSILRQLTLALAIIVLLVFESFALRIQTADAVPANAYAVAATIYIVYFVLAWCAFEPVRSAEV